MRVRATQTGFYGGSRRREGTEFTLTNPKHFSKRWMEKVTAAEAADADAGKLDVGKPAKGGKAGKPEPTTLREMQDAKAIPGKDVGNQSVI